MKSLEQYSKEIPEGMLTVSRVFKHACLADRLRSRPCRYTEYYRKPSKTVSLSPRPKVSERLWSQPISPRPV